MEIYSLHKKIISDFSISSKLTDAIFSKTLKNRNVILSGLINDVDKSNICKLFDNVPIYKIFDDKVNINIINYRVDTIFNINDKSHDINVNGTLLINDDLVDMILDTLPTSTWSDATLKWIDPCLNSGKLLVNVIFRLMSGLSDYIQDPCIRYAYILKNMIYVCSESVHDIFKYICIIDPLSEYTHNIFNGTIDSADFDKYKLVNIGNSNFDISVYISSFSAKKYITTLDICYDFSNIVLTITPSVLFFNKNNNSKLRLLHKIGDNINKLIIFNGNHYSLNYNKYKTPLSIVNLNKLHSDTNIFSIKYDNTSNEYTLAGPAKLPSGYYEPNEHTLSILYKLYKYLNKNKNLGTLLTKYDINAEHFISIPLMCGDITSSDKHDLVRHNFSSLFYINTDLHNVNTKYNILLFKNELEVNNCVAYLKLKITRFFILINKLYNINHNSRIFNNIPSFDFNTCITDTYICNELMITPDEIAYIDKIIPDYFV